MSKNAYLQKQKAAMGVYQTAAIETYIQFMADTLVVTLNSPDIMGNDTFGPERLKKVLDGWGEVFNTFHPALKKGPEADVMQDKLDTLLQKAMKDEGMPFNERYTWLKNVTYGGKAKWKS